MSNLRKILIATAAITAIPFLPASAQDSTARDAQSIVNKASAAAYYQGTDGKARVTMTITDSQGRERAREFVILRKDVAEDNGEQRFYVYFSRPADVNRTSFMVWKHVGADDDRWLYLPALDLVKRIAASDERTSFVGSHFFYEDVSGRGPDEDTHELIEEADTYFLVESTPKDPASTEFTRYRNFIHKTTFIPFKTEYYNANGEIYRTYSATKVETVDGFPTVVESKMEDSLIGGATVMGYSSVEYDLDLPEDIFTERYLRNPERSYLR